MASRRGVSTRGADNNWLPDEDEESLRRIHEVEDSERNFIERNVDVAETINFIREGVGFELARAMETNPDFAEANNPEKLLNILKRERIQTELYKAVAGLDIYETNPYSAHLRDPKNFLSSRTNRAASGAAERRRIKREILETSPSWRPDFTRLLSVTGEVDIRFGQIAPIEARRRFVAERTRPALHTILTAGIPAVDFIAAEVGCDPRGAFGSDADFLDALVIHLAAADLTALETIRNAFLPGGVPNSLSTNQAFLDLILLVDIDARETRKIGASSVFTPRRLTRIYGALPAGVRTAAETILELDALHNLETSSDARACLATIQDRLAQLGPADFEAELNSIRNEEMTVPGPGIPAPNIESNRLSPFGLMERILRREYCALHGLDPLHFNEHANAYAQLKARLRAKEAENIDIQRLANREAAINLNRGRTVSAYNRIVAAVGKTQRRVGLEPVEVGRQTAQDMLEQIINQKPEFGVFRGINKYSTVRDIRQLLYEKATPVNPAVIQEFTGILKEAIKGFRARRRGAEYKVLSDEWDLVGLIETLQKLQVEVETRELIDAAKAGGAGATEEHKYLNFLTERRKIENLVKGQLQADLESPDAAWKIYLSKNAIKEALSQKGTERRELLVAKQIAQLEESAAQLQAQVDDAAVPEARKGHLRTQISVIEQRISALQQGNENLKSLKQRMDDAIQFVEENKLSGSEAHEYYETLGLTQVIDKMGTNLRLARYWRKTKSGAASLWTGTKNFASWCKKKFGGATETTAKLSSYPGGLVVRPGYEVAAASGRLLGLVGSAVGGIASIPGGVWRGINSSAMQRYLLKEPGALAREGAKINKKLSDIKNRLAAAKAKNYGQNYQRMLESRIINLETDLKTIGKKYSKLEEIAKKKSLKISPLTA